MLEQRRAAEKGYITLKEAAKISNYSPDYIGQLIRSGRIHGEQVYSNVAWVTTEEEVRAYMANKSRTVEENIAHDRYQALGERVFSCVLYSVIALLFVALLFMQYILYVTLDDSMSDRLMSATATDERS